MVADRESLERLTAPNRFDTCVEWLIGTLLVFAPLAFGTTQAWSQEILFALVGAAALCVLLKWSIDRTTTLVWTWAYVPMILFVLLCAAQLIALPASTLAAISPGTISLKRELLQSDPNASDLLKRATVSFYPAASLIQLRLVLAVIAMFFVVINVYRDPARIRRLLLIITCAGLAVAAMAIYQNLSGTDLVYGMIPAEHKNSGPFMNYSHFGQFMNLSIGAALALIFVRWAEMLERSGGVVAFVAELSHPRYWTRWLPITLCVIGPITIFLSLTRMGTLSFIISGALLAAIFAWRGRTEGRGTILFALAVLVFAVLLCVGFDAVYARLATLRNVHAVDGGRTRMLKDIWLETRHFPIFGAGLGSHEFIFPLFDHSNTPLIATHAENEYAQLFEECGIVGLLLAGVFLVSVAINYAKNIWRPTNTIQYAAFGIAFGVIAILIHSGTDFGQHVPSNALLTATFAALLFTLATRPWSSSYQIRKTSSFRSPIILRGIACAAVVVMCAMILMPVDRARRAELQWGRAELIADGLQKIGWQGQNDDFVELLKYAGAAAKLAPDNVKYQYELSGFRWRAISRNVDPVTHDVVLNAASVPFVSRIVGDLQATRALCPSFGPALSLAGALDLDVLNQPKGAGEIELGFRLSPYDRIACLSEGRLALHEKNWPAAKVGLSRYVALGGSARDAVDLFLRAGKPEMAYEIASGKRDELERLGKNLMSDPTQTALAKRCEDEATSLLVAEAAASHAPANVLADLAATYQAAGNKKGAIEFYERALNLDYGQVTWRLQLGQILAEVGRSADAAREARVCLRLRPQSTEARTLLASVARDPSSAGDGTVRP